ncbi:MAG: hypothetical protein R2822_14645 [Spirosomataceae bacterium]
MPSCPIIFIGYSNAPMRVHLVYVTDPNTYNGGEKSRFILQLQHELIPRAKDTMRFQEHIVLFQSAAGKQQAEALNSTLSTHHQALKIKIGQYQKRLKHWHLFKGYLQKKGFMLLISISISNALFSIILVLWQVYQKMKK